MRQEVEEKTLLVDVFLRFLHSRLSTLISTLCTCLPLPPLAQRSTPGFNVRRASSGSSPHNFKPSLQHGRTRWTMGDAEAHDSADCSHLCGMLEGGYDEEQEDSQAVKLPSEALG